MCCQHVPQKMNSSGICVGYCASRAAIAFQSLGATSRSTKSHRSHLQSVSLGIYYPHFLGCLSRTFASGPSMLRSLFRQLRWHLSQRSWFGCDRTPRRPDSRNLAGRSAHWLQSCFTCRHASGVQLPDPSVRFSLQPSLLALWPLPEAARR